MNALNELKSNNPSSELFSEDSLLHKINELSEWSDDAYLRIEGALHELAPLVCSDHDLFRDAVHDAAFVFSHLALSFGWAFDDDDHFEYQNLTKDQIYDWRERVNLAFTGFLMGTMPDMEALESCNRQAERGITKKCTGVAGRAEFEINVTGGNPVILDVMRLNPDGYFVHNVRIAS